MGTASADTNGVLRVIKKSKNYLTPVFEAFTNALDSVSEKYKEQTATEGRIVVSISVKKLHEAIEFESLSVWDNGVGFTPVNFERFSRLFDASKSKHNNGSGRIQYLHSFSETIIKSVYEKNGQFFHKEFQYGISFGDNFTGQLFRDEPTIGPTYAEVTFRKPNLPIDERLLSQLNAEVLRDELICHYLLKFTGKNFPQVNIKYLENEEEKQIEEISSSSIPAPSSTVDLSIKLQYPHLDEQDKFSWIEKEKEVPLEVLSFKLPNNLLKQNRTVLFCDQMAVEDIPGIFKATEHFGEYQYFTAIRGSYLDKLGVEDQARTKINLPSKQEIEELTKKTLFVDESEGYVFLDTISKEIENKKYEIYPEVKTLEDKQKQKIDEIAEAFCISPEVVEKTSFDANDTTNEQILAKLYSTESKILSTQDAKIKNLFDETKKLDPTDDLYKKEIRKKSRKLLSMIPKQNAISLGRYVAHRELTVKMMKFIIKGELEIQKKIQAEKGKKKKNKNEALLHDLLLPRKTGNDSNQALWIFDEQFAYFEGYSDLPLREIMLNGEPVFDPAIEQHPDYKSTYGDKRPDICLFPEEGKCVIIEFKAPDVDISKYTNQIPMYVRLLANFTQPKFKFDTFYSYLVGENIDDMYLNNYRRSLFPGVWISDRTDIRGIGDEQDKVKAHLYQEIISWSALAQRGMVRNRKFAEILGIRKRQETGNAK